MVSLQLQNSSDGHSPALETTTLLSSPPLLATSLLATSLLATSLLATFTVRGPLHLLLKLLKVATVPLLLATFTVRGPLHLLLKLLNVVVGIVAMGMVAMTPPSCSSLVLCQYVFRIVEVGRSRKHIVKSAFFFRSRFWCWSPLSGRLGESQLGRLLIHRGVK